MVETRRRYAEGEAGATAEAADGADEDKLGEEQQTEFTKVEKAVRTTGGGATGSVRNLRIREDTAKYLLNLDPKSAHYDPKSRSMRADPNPDKAAHEKTFAGDNALRESGDEYEFWRRVTEHTVLEAEKGSAAHLQAAPTQAVMAHSNFKEKKARLAAKAQAAVLQKYGDASAAAPSAAELGLGESEAYVEYDRTCAFPSFWTAVCVTAKARQRAGLGQQDEFQANRSADLQSTAALLYYPCVLQ